MGCTVDTFNKLITSKGWFSINISRCDVIKVSDNDYQHSIDIDYDDKSIVYEPIVRHLPIITLLSTSKIMELENIDD